MVANHEDRVSCFDSQYLYTDIGLIFEPVHEISNNVAF